MDEEIKIEENKIIIFNKGNDGSLYERIIYLWDKQDKEETSENNKDEVNDEQWE